MNAVRLSLLFTALGFLIAQPCLASKPVTIEMAGKVISLEVAQSAYEQRQGLMHKTSLAPNTGMIFYFDPPRRVAMWMKNTYIDLDAAFIDPCGRILNIESMQAQTLDLHHSRGVVHSVIEMNAGWFEKHGLEPHDQIKALSHPQYCRPKSSKTKRPVNTHG